MNQFLGWKNLLLWLLLLTVAIYAIPNLFGENPAIQASSSTPGASLEKTDVDQIKSILDQHHVEYDAVGLQNKSVFIRFKNTDTQLQAQSILKTALADRYMIALNLEKATPKWLMAIGANPMKLGLDLRGGVHFLLQIDLDSVVSRRFAGYARSISEELRQKHIRYSSAIPNINGITLSFRQSIDRDKARDLLKINFSDFSWSEVNQGDQFLLNGKLLPAAMQKISQYTIEQTMSTLRKRVNELGVSEAVVQQQGQDRISVDLPGVQDSAQAKNIIGKVATLEFHLVDIEHDGGEAAKSIAPPGSELYRYENMPVLLKNRVILTGDSITGATATFDPTSGKPSVAIRLGGGGESLFSRVTADNIGKPIGTVYVEIKPETQKINNEEKIIYKKEKRVINIATIQSALGSNFQITGLSSVAEASNLALLLRAGSLPAGMSFLQERTVGPSMGQANINKGMLSIVVGTLLVILFMAFYYRVFGLVADLGLLINLVFLSSILSILGATLTFPGIAGIVLTMGMAVDANVLIYERIREELRKGVTPLSAIRAGYDRAFVTIVDANITALLVALILFALGSGSVKGFAIVLIIGLLTSMLSATVYTRAIVNWIYGGKRVSQLSIGIRVKGGK